ncbi:hypothetical protein BC629DRAFT_1446729 [Irpex lacteus]|nr:hypothetical protein BC629DRAFT_1446729 [Irpex lacteus]
MSVTRGGTTRSWLLCPVLARGRLPGARAALPGEGVARCGDSLIVEIDALILEERCLEANVDVSNRELVTGVVVEGLETERVVEALLDDLPGATEDSREMERLGVGGGASYLLPSGALESRRYDGPDFLCSVRFGSGGTGEGAMDALLVGPTLIALGGRDLRPLT